MDWQSTLYSLPGIIVGLTVHEYCHARAAFALGDTTAKDQGRLTLNPLRHIDLIGFIFILVAGFGWAKPVQFSPGALRHPRRDKALIAAAGPVSNLLMALILVLLFKGSQLLLRHLYALGLITEGNSGVVITIMLAILQGTIINMGLFVFNLIPIPPLDGSHIVFSGLNLAPETEYRIMRIGAPALFIILIVQNRIGITILPIGKIVRTLLGILIPELR
ncbi:metalloprotease [Spirochaetia bacterium]|nr:metalloprotease [Spirochaetia bacterium]